jgi:hypothetical protein
MILKIEREERKGTRDMHDELYTSLRVQSYTAVAAISKTDGSWPEDMDMHVYYMQSYA